MALGTLGLPRGAAWIAAAVGRGLTGGELVTNANAVLLRAVGGALIHQENVPEARRALEASLNYEYDADVYQWLQTYPV